VGVKSRGGSSPLLRISAKGLTTSCCKSFFRVRPKPPQHDDDRLGIGMLHMLACSVPASLKKFAWDFTAGQQVHGAAGGIDDGVVQSKAQGVIDDCAEVFDADFA
jgi:hypothetical protein